MGFIPFVLPGSMSQEQGEEATGTGDPEQITVAARHCCSQGRHCSMAGHGHVQIRRTLGQSFKSPSLFSLNGNPFTAPQMNLRCRSEWQSPDSSNFTTVPPPWLFANLDFMKPDHFSERPLDPHVHLSHRAMCLPTGISSWTVNHLISFSSYTEFIDFLF